ncbi:signal recognition particle-docking protein FtsY [Synechococcus sp. OH20]|uniref:signal recognition particle-docking protein FtsY n=1 Tax=Synechococcus sp. OH20 TaxID=139337 RepID=UPI0039C72EF2
MAFDWFRRRYTDSPGEAKPSPPDPTSATKPAEISPEDYLAFAKAAYANLKARAAGQEAPAKDSVPLEQTDGQIEGIPAEALQPQPPASPPEPIPTKEPVSPESPSVQPAAAPSFFDLAPRAAERLQALQASAVEEPEPMTPAVAPSPETGPEELVFDEGFRWSAEILAAQGRKPEEISVEEISWLQKLRRGLGKTRLNLINQLKALVGRGPLDQKAVEEIEALLLQADVGIDATERIIQALQKRMREEVVPPEEAVKYLKQQMRQMLTVGDPTFAPQRGTLNIWLIVGVNGAGKTTTIGKIAHVARESGYRCLIAAADTFRAAAVEQLKVWAERAGVEVIANPSPNADPAAVVFDAITAAQARGTELLLVDTAGRLQNKKNLMEELAKIRRIIDKKAPEAKVESLLVLDATQGQNGLRQAAVFSEVAKLSGVILTKLDSTAKGGIALAITQQMHLPIRFIGAGEGLEDLRPFSSYEFVEALLSEY